MRKVLKCRFSRLLSLQSCRPLDTVTTQGPTRRFDEYTLPWAAVGGVNNTRFPSFGNDLVDRVLVLTNNTLESQVQRANSLW